MSERPVSELFHVIVSWMATQHPRPMSGLLEATTPDVEPGPIRVRLNASRTEQDGIAPYEAVLLHAASEWPIGVVNPAGGALMASLDAAESEDGLIAHFRAAMVQPIAPEGEAGR